MWRVYSVGRVLATVLVVASLAGKGDGGRVRSEGEIGRVIAEAETKRPGFLYTRIRGRCTPEYWSSRREAWPKMVPITASAAKIFGSQALERYRPDLTLFEATNRNDFDDAFVRLLREASASLLNAYARRDFPYASWKVKSLLIRALVSERAALEQASLFSQANQGCD